MNPHLRFVSRLFLLSFFLYFLLFRNTSCVVDVHLHMYVWIVQVHLDFRNVFHSNLST
jgi:hypothetical protein